MELLLGREAAAVAGVTGVMISTQLDVTSQQHLFLLGQNGANFLSVMHQTHTQIVLPDLSAPQHTPSLLIQGTADGVCLARQQLMVSFLACDIYRLKLKLFVLFQYLSSTLCLCAPRNRLLDFCTRMLTVDRLCPLSCAVGPLLIRLLCPARPADAQSD